MQSEKIHCTGYEIEIWKIILNIMIETRKENTLKYDTSKWHLNDTFIYNLQFYQILKTMKLLKYLRVLSISDPQD